jgi:hypothetical protein
MAALRIRDGSTRDDVGNEYYYNSIQGRETRDGWRGRSASGRTMGRIPREVPGGGP